MRRRGRSRRALQSALTRSSHCTPSPPSLHRASRTPGVLQKFPAFFLFRLGPREAFHAFFFKKTDARAFVDAVAEIDGYIPPAASLTKQTSTDNDSFPWHVYRRLFCTRTALHVRVRSTTPADASSGRYTTCMCDLLQMLAFFGFGTEMYFDFLWI